MSKGKQTKERIIQQAAELFNQKGYAGSSIADIMRVTGLQKGGIYNHFESKDELALQAFDYAVSCIRQRYSHALRGKRHAIERLQAIIDVFRSYEENPPIAGGCPVLNTAIESDDAHPALRDRTQQAMNGWRDMICRIINIGIKKGEIRPHIDPGEIATIMISTLEGAVMMSKLYSDAIHLTRVINHLHDYIDRNLRA